MASLLGMNPMGEFEDALGLNEEEKPQANNRPLSRKEKQEMLQKAELERMRSQEALELNRVKRREDHEKRTGDIRAKYNIPDKSDKKKAKSEPSSATSKEKSQKKKCDIL
eukprot:Sdes_comp18063_c0_seq1m7453